MTRIYVNRISFMLPLLLSALAFALVVANILAGVPPSLDENASAHIFQILIAAQAPIIAVFLVTSHRRSPQWALLFGLQIVCIGIALLPVWFAGY